MAFAAFMFFVIGYIVLSSNSAVSLQTDVLIYGSSLGGTSAAITAAQKGAKVILVSESMRLGGQAVVGGVSAFDEITLYWPQYSIFADLKDFLRKKYEVSTSEEFVGPGRAVVGPVSTLPSDIDEFFSVKLQAFPNVTVLKGYDLLDVQRKGTHVIAAVIQKKGEQNSTKILIRFQYILDGTETGKIIQKTGQLFDIGFDSREQTGEPTALSASLRNILMTGTGGLPGIGNRVQSIGVPFAVYDKGYRGDFFPAFTQNVPECWHISSNVPFIGSSHVYKSNQAGCSVSIGIQPDFTDTYDLYYINHGASSLSAKVSTSYLSRPVEEHLDNIGQKVLVKMGTWFIDSKLPLQLSFNNMGKGYAIEGILLVKRNIHIRPLEMKIQSQETKSFSYPGFSTTITDTYLVSSSNYKEKPSVTINGIEKTPQYIGSGVYLLPSVTMFNGGNTISIWRANVQETWHVVIAPIQASANYLFGCQTLKSTSGEWRCQISPSSAEEYIISVSSSAVASGRMDIIEENTQRVVTSAVVQYSDNRRTPIPLSKLLLEEGVQYEIVLRIGAGESIPPPLIYITPVTQSNILLVEGSGALSVTSPLSSMFDIWITSKGMATTVHGYSVNRTISTTLKRGDGMRYLGKGFLPRGSSFMLSVDQYVSVLLVPTNEVDVFWLDQGNVSNRQLRVPPGKYQFLLEATSILTNPSSLTISGSQNFKQQLPLHRDQGSFVASESLISNNTPFTIQISGRNVPSSNDIVLYEEIPEATPNLFRFESPLLKQTLTPHYFYINKTFFNYRNLLSPESLLSARFSSSFSEVARTNLGLALVLTSSNDFAPVFPIDLDTNELYQKAKALSYEYYYWIRYESPLNGTMLEEQLGCEYLNEALCDPRRIYLAMDALGTVDGFSEKPYIREGRRMRTKKPISLADISITYEPCFGSCDLSRCQNVVDGGHYCLLKEQVPHLLPDAVAAVFYFLDIHSYLSRIEQYQYRPLLQSVEQKQQQETGEPTQFRTFRLAAPTEISLGSIIPMDEGSNVFPASLNIGMTQMASASLRTHITEIHLGAAVGHLMAYCLLKHISPHEIYANSSLIQDFQRFLIGEGMILYPIQDTFDPKLKIAVQHLILAKKLVPKVSFKDPKGSIVDYIVEPSQIVTIEEESMLRDFGLTVEGQSFRKLIYAITHSDATLLSDESALQIGSELHLFTEITGPSDVHVLDKPLTKGALYRASYMLLLSGKLDS